MGIDNKIEQAMVSAALGALLSTVASLASLPLGFHPRAPILPLPCPNAPTLAHRVAGPSSPPDPAGPPVQDLVKSHLMFAVREEVEVLKEQIRELAERNAALEQENGLLRALASPEQLAQLPSGGLPRLGPPAPNGPSV